MQIRLDMEEKRPYNKPIGREQQPVGGRRFCAEEGRARFSFFLLFIDKGVLRGALSLFGAKGCLSERFTFAAPQMQEIQVKARREGDGGASIILTQTSSACAFRFNMAPVY